MQQKGKLTIAGHTGTWYVIAEGVWEGEPAYLLESEQYGEDAACIIVDDKLNILLDDVWNGMDELNIPYEDR